MLALLTEGGEYGGWFGGASTYWTEKICSLVSRCVPILWQTEGSLQHESCCATGTDVSKQYWLKPSCDLRLLFQRMLELYKPMNVNHNSYVEKKQNVF